MAFPSTPVREPLTYTSSGDTSVTFHSQRLSAWVKALKSLYGDPNKFSMTETQTKKGKANGPNGTAYKIKPKSPPRSKMLTVTLYDTGTVLVQGSKEQVDKFKLTTFHQLVNLIDSASLPEAPDTPDTQFSLINQGTPLPPQMSLSHRQWYRLAI